MPISWNGFSYLEPIKKAINSGLRDREDIDIAVAGANFVDLVRDRAGFTSFSADRVGGSVGAKTIPADDGLVILNMPALSQVEVDDIEKIVCHEVGHILTYRRGDLQSLGSTPELYGDADFRTMASSIIDEFRAEKYAAECGYDLRLPPTDLALGLHETNLEVLTLLVDEDLSTKDLAYNVLILLKGFMKRLGNHLVRDTTSDLLNRFDAATSDLWTSMLGDSWIDVAEILGDTPSADEAVENLDEYIDSLGDALQIVLKVWGFELFDEQQYPGFFRNASDNVFQSRYTYSEPFLSNIIA